VVKNKTVVLNNQKAFRLINSKFPPETLFDDVADAEEFEAIYAIQVLTNPRIKNELGNLNLIAKEKIPFGIDGVNYATAPFTHINPDGSRFSDGNYGVLYLAETISTAIAETRFHQEKYFQNIPDLRFDTITMRGITFTFTSVLVDATANEKIHNHNSYRDAITFAKSLIEDNSAGVQYNSVRAHDSLCWALFSPEGVHSAVQSKHFEFIYDGKGINTVREISLPNEY
jgi:RES domain-containing protein